MGGYNCQKDDNVVGSRILLINKECPVIGDDDCVEKSKTLFGSWV